MTAASLHTRSPASAPVLTAKDAAKLRKRMERAVERLIAAMDALDVDTDLEDGGDDEPSLGSLGSACGAQAHSQEGWSLGCPVLDELEEENEHSSDDDQEGECAQGTVDDEPSLGSGNVEPHLTHTVLGRAMSSVDQTQWGSGPTEDREDDGGDAGSDEDEGTVAGMLASGPMSDADHVKVREARERLLQLVGPKPARDPDACVILAPGLAQLVARPVIGRLR